jgi:hypothetical protein
MKLADAEDRAVETRIASPSAIARCRSQRGGYAAVHVEDMAVDEG